MGGRSSKTSGNQSLEHVITEALAHVGLESSKKPLRLDKIHDTKSRSSTTCIVVICHEGVLMGVEGRTTSSRQVLKDYQDKMEEITQDLFVAASSGNMSRCFPAIRRLKEAMVKDADHSVTNAGGYLKEYVNGLLERKLSVPFFRLILCARRGGLYEIGYFNSNTRKTSLLQDIGDSIVIGSGMHWADFYLYGGVKSSQFHPEVNDSEIRSQVHQLQLQLSKSGVAKVDYGRFETNLGSQRVQLAKLSENPKSKATLGKNSAIIDEIRVTKDKILQPLLAMQKP
ncbi:hypothetical protein GIB67_039381 [Kingdonia uniflora]|uniref:Uncharacterized protein n=1 Tax=Kingdonia uniflora TaxID=39325 RepID=A0A7J7NK81_9MAGN|nr:hypothetical protein GIB67_039381 [Kingdonia uniflora]